MDQTTKQRLVGATVLVVAVLWLLPVFLDGPAETTETISETVELPGIDTQPNQARTIDLIPEDPEPAETDVSPAAAGPESAAAPDESPNVNKSPVIGTPAKKTTAVAAKSEMVVASSSPDPAPTGKNVTPEQSAKPATSPVKAGGDLWAVQLGSFSTRQNAEKLAAELRQQGFAAFISEHSAAETVMHRVRIGPIKGREAADAEAAKLAKSGQSGQVVAHP